MAQLTALADVSHEAESLLCRLHEDQGGSVRLTLIPCKWRLIRLHRLAEELSNARSCRSQPCWRFFAGGGIYTEESLAGQAPTEEAVAEPTEELLRWLILGRGMRAGQGEFGSLLERLLLEQADSLPDISLLDSATRPATPAPDANEAARLASTNPHETIRLPALFVDGLIDRVVELNVQQVHMSEHFSSMGMDVDELVRTVARLRQQIRTLEVESEAQIHDGRSKSFQTR